MGSEPIPGSTFDAKSITRPERVLKQYYLVTSAFGLIFFPFIYLPFYFKYKTLKYRFDEEGISMAWGLLWHREINLTYRRIQDIHVNRGLIERWMGLATISIQTASGSAGAEMTIVGITHFDEMRDFLYQKMRGARGLDDEREQTDGAQPQGVPADEALELLREIRDELHTMRQSREGGS